MSEILLSELEIAERVNAAAERLAAMIDDDTVCICLLTGGLWFAADLMRCLAKHGRNPLFDAVWLASYGDARETSGQVTVRARLQRDVTGKRVVLIDDVCDSGTSLLAAAGIVREAGAASVLSAVFAMKPWPSPRTLLPDVIAWEAPGVFLVGYGMDDGGRMRGLPEIRQIPAA